MSRSLSIFVTGGHGFLGRHLTSALEKVGHHVVAPRSSDCNLLDPAALTPWNSRRFDRIYHLAAWTQAGDFCLHHPGEQWVHNQRLNTTILEWWASSQKQAKLITIGTSCAYAPDRELREENYLEGQPIDSLFTYAMTKRMLWIGQLALAKQYGLKHLTLIPSTLYGPEYHSDGRQLHFIFDLIRKILRGHLYNEPVILWGDGHQRRELIHVDDFVRVALELSPRVEGQVVNVGAGEEYPIRTFAELICLQVGYDPSRIQYDTSKYTGARSKCLEITRLRRLWPDFNPISLGAGLKPVIAWVREKLVEAAPPEVCLSDRTTT
ncbi:MAG: NAD-dependent epimerase/dehydratase family protein [Opitutaceae bacterium]|nr:NAD-dependent epimerase/dehydratase family protein [Opitutaceae bacterium]